MQGAGDWPEQRLPPQIDQGARDSGERWWAVDYQQTRHKSGSRPN